MAYDTAGNIISDAASELGLGTVGDAYGSQDANIIQLRGLLKSAGRDIVRDRDWTHLVKEYSFVTRPNWATSTVYTAVAGAWTTSTAYALGALVTSNGNLYRCTTAGTSSALPLVAFGGGPSGTGTGIPDGSFGTARWTYLNAGIANLVTSGLYYYRCTGEGGTSAAPGPVGTLPSGGFTNDGGGISWVWQGNAADYTLPSDFSNLIDQTGWNRTNRLPVGGPVDGQMWQYLKGRQQGVVFNVMFRPVAGVMRLYPDTDTPGGYSITFEYVSTWWAGTNGSTAPTMDAPTANSDVIYFDPLLIVRRLRLDWLKAKGFDTSHAQDLYDECAEQTMNADGSAPVLNLRGRGPYDPLIGVQNVPITGFGS